jgi:hypothetical protein
LGTDKDLELSGECGHNNLQSGLKKKVLLTRIVTKVADEFTPGF